MYNFYNLQFTIIKKFFLVRGKGKRLHAENCITCGLPTNDDFGDAIIFCAEGCGAPSHRRCINDRWAYTCQNCTS